MTQTNERFKALTDIGQAPWLDSISREWLDSGFLETLRDTYALRGVTSNPAIFQTALKSDVYHDDIRRLANDGLTDREIFHHLAIDDIRRTCDIFMPVHEATQDGFVSIEVDPDLAHDVEATVNQAITFNSLIDRPNLMIKIPATEAGIVAIEQALTLGININVTLLFDTGVAARVREAWLNALTARLDAGKPVDNIYSVASFFISRVDSKVDPLLDELDPEIVEDLRGSAAVANAAVAWDEANSIDNDPRWIKLKAMGASKQRLLWASTGTKDPSYAPTKYIDELIAPNTVNTIPLKTIEAYAETGDLPQVSLTEERVLRARRELDHITECDIDLSEVTEQLRDDGVSAFIASFDDLLNDVKSARLAALK